MFKKTKYKNQIILFISSYFPLYLIIFVQNCSSLYTKCSEILFENEVGIIEIFRSKKLFKLAFYRGAKFTETYLLLICFTLMIASYLLINKMIKNINNYSESAFSVKVVNAKSLNYEYVVTYFSIYIFPFITLNLSSLSGIIQFFILWLLIGYVYVKNSLVYVNPMLNIVFKYNIYNIELKCEDEEDILCRDIILFTKKEKYSLENRVIKVIKENSELYIEIIENQ